MHKKKEHKEQMAISCASGRKGTVPQPPGYALSARCCGRQEFKMARKKLSKEKSLRRTKFYAQCIVCLAVLGAGAFLIKGAADRSTIVSQSPYADDSELPDATVETAPAEPDPDKVLYESSMVNTKDKYRGDLILVNNEHQYYSGDEDLVSILEMNDETDRHFFTSVDYSYKILGCVYEPMARMIEDFYNLYYNDTLTIYGSYRTTEFQQQLYDEDLASTGENESTRVAKPGFSEHETGYAFDFSETVNNDYDGTGDFAWINENCYKYGFILRYPEDKESITEIQYEPWHFRYVGIPHAYYMTKNDLCLEEYIDLVRGYAYGDKNLEFTDDNGKSYEVYFVPSDDGAETTTVPVPAGKKYTVSGNNIDGFIVTVYNDGIPAIMQYKPGSGSADSSDADSSENTDDTADTADSNDGDSEDIQQ